MTAASDRQKRARKSHGQATPRSVTGRGWTDRVGVVDAGSRGGAHRSQKYALSPSRVSGSRNAEIAASSEEIGVCASSKRRMARLMSSKSASQGHSSAAYGPVARAAATAKPLSNADGFRGLVNQGATCYLSSVVQSLYMTPEFRAAIYALGGPPTAEIGSGGAEAAPIAWTLQELFVHLQTSEQTAVETRALTASFGWASADSFEQVAGVG